MVWVTGTPLHARRPGGLGGFEYLVPTSDGRPSDARPDIRQTSVRRPYPRRAAADAGVVSRPDE